MLEDILSPGFKIISLSEVGDNSTSDRNVLKGYKAESQLKRVIDTNRAKINMYLQSMYHIPPVLKSKSELKNDYEDFQTIDLIKSKLVGFNSKTCIKLHDLYVEKGLLNLIDKIHSISPIDKI